MQGTPDPQLISDLELALTKAKNGEINCAVLLLFDGDGHNSIVSGSHHSIFSLLGAVTYLQVEITDQIKAGEGRGGKVE